MPLYEFECLDCGHQFTETMLISDYEERRREGFKCPDCNGHQVEQLAPRVTVQTSKKS